MTTTTDDKLLGGRISLLQPAKGYRAAIDPVLLAASIPVREGGEVLDLGCGAGAAMLCLAARVPGCRGMGLEIQPDMAMLAQENIVRNGFEDRFSVLAGDVAHPSAELLAMRFDHVLANPPYLACGAATASPEAGKAVSHVEGAEGLAPWVKLASRLLRPKGTLTIIHRADRLEDILAVMGRSFGGIRIFPVWPKAGGEAGRVIVQGILGSRAPLRLLSGLVLHEKDGTFAKDAENILKNAAVAEPGILQ